MKASLFSIALILSTGTAVFAASCPVGDINGDCIVDFADVRMMAEQWLGPDCSGAGCANLDAFSGIDMYDFARLALNWGKEGAPLIISEFMAANAGEAETGQLNDEDGDSSDWIEIYNPKDKPINLDGWYLTDNDDDLAKWRFPAEQIGPGAFKIVFASGKDRAVAGAELHTNFRLDAGDSEYLALVAPDGATIAHEYAPEYPQQLPDISYGITQFATSVVPAGGSVKYHVPDAGDSGTDWTGVGFDDSNWETANTGLGFSGAPTESRDVGAVSASGGFTVTDGVYTVNGAGADIWNDADAFHYVYMPLSGDGEMIARVVSMTNTDQWAKAGVMIRETLEPGSKHVMEVMTVGNGAAFQRRLNTNGSSLNNGNVGGNAPYWVRIVRQGNTFTGYYSANGINWSQHGSETVSMQDDVYIGLALTSHSEGVICTAKFDNVSLGGSVGGAVKDRMLGINTSLWMRAEFTVEDPDFYDTLTLRMRYEDGFVAYLNGQPVATRNAPSRAGWDASALSDRPADDATVFEDINLLSHLGLLRPHPQTNVLAVHAMNDDENDEEFLILPELVVASNQEVPQYFTTPTPGQFNVSGAQGIVEKVWVSHERGFYNSPFRVSLSTGTDGARVIYTTDGSRPTAANGTPYTTPFWISRTTTLRAAAVKAGYIDSKVETNTYIFVNDVISQSPNGESPGPGWPSGSVNGQDIDYGMDPQIVQQYPYSDQIDDALLAIPTLSFVTDLDNLFNPSTGIYVNARGQGRAWERPVSIELMNSDGSDGFQIDGGLRIRGGFSRTGGNPKHAFRLFFRSEYGENELEYPLFGDEGADTFKKMDLRCSQNYSWAFQGNDNNTMVREVWSRDLQGEMGHYYTRSRYYHLYINGHYWGLYQTQERAEAAFAETYMGGKRDDYDVVKSKTGERQVRPTDGNLEAYRRFYDLAVQGFENNDMYWRLQGLNPDGTRNPDYEKHLDVDNLIDFMIIEYYSGDRDGPGSRYGNVPNNMIAIFNRNDPQGWFWMQHDSEHSLGTGENNLVTPLTTAGAQWQYFNCQWLHEQMTADPDYRQKFGDHVQKHLFNGGLLTLEKSLERLNERAAAIDMAVVAESARWGDGNHEPPYTRNTWLGAVNEVRSWITGRIPTLLSQFRGQGWFPSIDAPVYSTYGGMVSPGTYVSLTNPNGVGKVYYTTDGSDPRVPVAQSSPGDQVTLVSEDATKRVHIPTQDIGGGVGTVLAEYWYDISGTAISDLTGAGGYPDSPDAKSYLNRFEIPVDVREQYGARVRGYLHPPTTGDYTFWMASDDNGQLWLSSDATPTNAELIARVDSWTPSRSWDRFSTQRSSTIHLVAGRKYYIEGLMKEQGGGDNLAAAWRGPGFSRRIIDGQYLSPAGVGWVVTDFDDSQWTTGTGGVGYETSGNTYADHFDINVRNKMSGKNATCYIRIPFTVLNPDLRQLSLKIKYDDGFIAYLNGAEIKRVNFDQTLVPQWNSEADASNPDDAAVQWETIDISQYIDKLKFGSNVLAIHGLNFGKDNSDFLISAELVGFEASTGDVSENAVEFTGPVQIDEPTVLKSRVYTGVWSALVEAAFAVDDITDDLRITEIMYHPESTGDPEDPNAEYIEVANIGESSINLKLAQFTDGIDFTFDDTVLGPGEIAVVVKKRSVFENIYGTGVNIVGEYGGRLDNGGERIELVDALGNKILAFRYKDGWRSSTDGGGFSLTTVNAYNPDPNSWADNDSWRASAVRGGSPGWDDTGFVPNPGSIVINEVLAHSHAQASDWVELHNTTDQPIDISGWYLSDSDKDDPNLMKYRIADGTEVPPNGYVVLYENLNFGNIDDPGCIIPFALSENGEEIVLSSGQGTELTGYRDVEDFGASPTGVAFGRYRKSDGSHNFVAMSVNTPGAANAYPAVGPIVVNEIMYNPASGNQAEEYIELLNITSAPAVLHDYTTNEDWKFTDGIEFTFGADSVVTVPAGGYVLIVKDLAAYLSRYGAVPGGVQVFEYDDGSLSNGGEKLELSMPGDVDAEGVRHYIRIDRVNYSDGSHPEGEDPWPVAADGGGSSLSRIVPGDYGNDVANWTAGPASPGLPNP